MTIAITDLTIDKQYADDTILTEDQLDAAFNDADAGSTQEYVNTYVKDNLVQLAKDIMPTDWVFTNDGVQSLTNTIYNKQYSTKTYGAGTLALGTAADAGWVTVDAVNAAITFTPEYKGQYKVTFDFSEAVLSTATTEMECTTAFRITDGVSASAAKLAGGYIPATAANQGIIVSPLSVSYIFDWTTTSAKTIYLQKYVTAATAVDSHVIACAGGQSGDLHIIVEKI